VKLKDDSVERIYLRQRSSDGSNGSVNKTILKPRLSLATWDFPDVKFRVAAQLAGSLGKAAIFYSLYDIGESNPVPTSGLRSGSDTKVNQFVHVPTPVDTQHFIEIYARVFSNLVNIQTDRQTNKHGQKHVPPPLSEVMTQNYSHI